MSTAPYLRGQSSPTISTLHHLAAALGVRSDDSFGAEKEARVVFVRAGERGRTETAGALVESLAGQRIQPFLVMIEPGAGSGASRSLTTAKSSSSASAATWT